MWLISGLLTKSLCKHNVLPYHYCLAALRARLALSCGMASGRSVVKIDFEEFFLQLENQTRTSVIMVSVDSWILTRIDEHSQF